MKKHQRINLIPISHKAPAIVSVDHLLLFGVVVAILGCAIHFYFGYKTIERLTVEMAAVNEQVVEINKKVQEANSLISAGALSDEQSKLIREVIGSKPNWADAFKELSLIIPRETWLNQLVLKNNAGTIAVSIRGETSSQAYMADFLSSLEKSEFFNNIMMISSKISEQTNPPLYSFEFAAPGLNSGKTEATR